MFGEQSSDISPDDQSNSYPSNAINTWHTINARAIRFHFRSDSSTSRSGWNIDIAQGQPSNTPINGVIGQRLYLDPSGYDKVKDTGIISLGFIAATNAENDSIYMRSLDFSVYDGATGERGPAGKDAEIAITYDGNSVGSLLGISFSKNEGKISFQLDSGQEVTVQGSFTSMLN